MLNIDIKPKKIKENIFIAAPSKRCCVLEIFLVGSIGFTKKDIQNWIGSLSELELKNKVICLDGKVLEDFKAEYIKNCSLAGEDSLYMLTSDGVRGLFVHYEKNKHKLTKIDKTNIEKLSQKFINIFSAIHNERINHLVFWEEEVKDEINIPDMSRININNSPGAFVSTGSHNHIESNNTLNHDKKQKPKWLICVSWIFIITCLVWGGLSIYFKYIETHSIDSVTVGWKEGIQIIGMLFGILLRLY